MLATSYRALETSVAGVRDGQWDAATPCSEWTVTQVIQHAAADQLAYAMMLGIQTASAYDPFSPSGAVDGTAVALVEGRRRADRRGVGDPVSDDHPYRPDPAAAR